MKMTFRNFVYILKRFKTSSVLNLVGLSVALAVFLVILIQLRFDTSFNHNFAKVDTIYQVIAGQEYPSGMEYRSGIPNEATSIITERYPEIKNFCEIAVNNFDRHIEVFDADGSEREFDETTSIINGNLMDMFQLKILKGNYEDALKDGKAMVTESVAKKIFGDVSPIGKEVFLSLQKVTRHEDRVREISSKLTPIVIEAVCEDLPDNCSLNNGFFTYSSHYVTEDAISFDELYLEIPSSDVSALKQKVNTEEILSKVSVWKKDYFFKLDMEAHTSMKKHLKLTSISNIHTKYPTLGEKGKNKNHLYYLISIAIFILVTAYINFVNFSTALAPARVRSLNIQKILGADNFSLRAIIAFESVLFTLLSFLIALVLLTLYKESSVAQMFSSNPSIYSNWGLIILAGLVLLTISFLVGMYPAYFVTSFNQIMAINSKSGGGVKGSKLRDVLLVVQLFFAITLITISLFVKLQYDYMTGYDIGLNKDGVIYIQTQTWDKEYLSVKNEVFLHELLSTSNIKKYTASNYLPGASEGGLSIQEIEGISVGLSTLDVDEHFVDFFDIKVLDSTGVPFSVNKAMINNKAKEVYSELNLLGMECHDNEVVGITEDFNFENIENAINPLMLSCTHVNDVQYLLFKVEPRHLKEAITQIEATWKKYSSRPVNIQFLDEDITQQYQSYKDLGLILGLASSIIIAIALMGIYGMITFNTRYREKEIAIRKVSGASVNSVILILTKGLLAKVLIAFVLALPAIWIIVDKWLSQFALKIPMYWWIYTLGGSIILLIVILTVSMQSYKAAIKNPVDSLKSE